MLPMAVIGAGALGRHHARILSQMQGVRLVAVADPDAQRGQSLADACHTRWVPDYREIVSEISAACVVVPTSLHRVIAEDCLARNIDVLVEKPLAPSWGEASSIVHLAKVQQAILQVGHVERFNPAWQAAQPWCQQPRYVRVVRMAPFTFRSTDIGVIHDLMVHDIDLILSLTASRVHRVTAWGASLMGGYPDVVQAHIEFEDGFFADITANRVHRVAVRRWEVWARQGLVEIDFQEKTVHHTHPTQELLHGPSPLTHARSAGADLDRLRHQVYPRWLECHELDVPTQDALTEELREFVHCVTTRRQPTVSGEVALHTLELADRIASHVAKCVCDAVLTGGLSSEMPIGGLRRAG
ncbi:MAG: oxidoreductase [Planctomycetaceae bacterium]|nr:MAG: oxidoreductase [Planctomycetaceae bacterium]